MFFQNCDTRPLMFPSQKISRISVFLPSDNCLSRSETIRQKASILRLLAEPFLSLPFGQSRPSFQTCPSGPPPRRQHSRRRRAARKLLQVSSDSCSRMGVLSNQSSAAARECIVNLDLREQLIQDSPALMSCRLIKIA